MKILFLLALFSVSTASFGQLRDCYNCSWGLDDWYPPLAWPSEWPIEYITVEKENYQTNEAASFCIRPEEMLDTVVLHHSAGTSLTSAMEVNDYHVTRHSEGEPWYMLGYSYVIASPYPGDRNPTPRLSEGRPLHIVGSHAGSDAYVKMDKVQQRLWDEGKVVCGKTGEDFKVDPKQVKNGKIKANVTTLGIVILGNYAPFSKWNPSGYPAGKPRYPTEKTLDMAARMVCQLQKKYPRIKNLHWHKMYNSTDCPGTLTQKISRIKQIAKGLGCDFK